MPQPSGVRAVPTASRKLIAHPIPGGHTSDAALSALLAQAFPRAGRNGRRSGRGVTMLSKDAVERLLLDQLRLAGAPEPTHGPDSRGWRFHARRGWRIDFAWTDLLPILAVEVEGGVHPIRQQDGSYHVGRHVSPQGYEDDCIKYSEAALAGVLLLRVTTAMVCDQHGRPDGRALALILRGLEKTKPAVRAAGDLSYPMPA